MTFKRNRQTGFTVIETVIVLALVGLLTITVVGGASPQLKSETFSGKVREFTNVLREAQTKSFTIKSGTCTAAQSQATPASGTGCFWRGNTLEYVSGAPSYNHTLLYGGDLSHLSFNTDQRIGLTGRQTHKVYQLANLGLRIEEIDVFNTGSGAYVPAGGDVTLAFLAPDGKAYACYSNCDPATNLQPYADNRKIRITLGDESTNLKGIVMFDPANGTIEHKVQ